MVKKYDQIYKDLRRRIEEKQYPYQTLIPPESALVNEYACSRNTVRRAIAQLVEDGYLISVNGKGVVVVYKENLQAKFASEGEDFFQRIAGKNKEKYHKKVVTFQHVVIDKELAEETTFPVGSECYFIQRVRMIGKKAYILDNDYFLTSEMPELSAGIAERSVYDYYRDELHRSIMMTRRMMTVEAATATDRRFLSLGDAASVAVIRSYVFNEDGVMFEYTQSRHIPDGFVFFEQSNKNPVSYLY